MAVGILVAVIASLIVGFSLGYGTRAYMAKTRDDRVRIEHDARVQGQIDSLRAHQRPGIEPPSNYFRGDR